MEVQLRRIHLLRGWVNKSKKKGQGVRPGPTIGPRRPLFGEYPTNSLDTEGSCSMPFHSQRFRTWKEANTTMTSTFSIEEVLHSKTNVGVHMPPPKATKNESRDI